MGRNLATHIKRFLNTDTYALPFPKDRRGGGHRCLMAVKGEVLSWGFSFDMEKAPRARSREKAIVEDEGGGFLCFCQETSGRPGSPEPGLPGPLFSGIRFWFTSCLFPRGSSTSLLDVSAHLYDGLLLAIKRRAGNFEQPGYNSVGASREVRKTRTGFQP